MGGIKKHQENHQTGLSRVLQKKKEKKGGEGKKEKEKEEAEREERKKEEAGEEIRETRGKKEAEEKKMRSRVCMSLARIIKTVDTFSVHGPQTRNRTKLHTPRAAAATRQLLDPVCARS